MRSPVPIDELSPGCRKASGVEKPSFVLQMSVVPRTEARCSAVRGKSKFFFSRRRGSLYNLLSFVFEMWAGTIDKSEMILVFVLSSEIKVHSLYMDRQPFPFLIILSRAIIVTKTNVQADRRGQDAKKR